MRIRYYGYNSFVVHSGGTKLAIDPGGSFYLPDFFRTNIPKSEWSAVTHIVVTHGDPDHHWHTDRVAKASKAVVICSTEMVRKVGGLDAMIGPRNRGLAFRTVLENVRTVRVGETISANGLEVTGFKGRHGSLTLRVGSFHKTLQPGPEERIGLGETVFLISVNGTRLVNFGETLLLESAWNRIPSPDVAMVPIGGHSAMSAGEAVQAIRLLKPRVVIPCHYDTPALFSKKAACADAGRFKADAERLGARCVIMRPGDEFEYVRDPETFG